jgi:pimeloyl-ACP methyl ester carboxylesterase
MHCSTACFHRTTCRGTRQDAATAHALGLLLGRRVLLIGCSTGGTLALWLASQPWVDGLVGLVLVSPGLRLSMPSLQWTVLGWLALLLPRAAAHGLVRAANGGPTKKANAESEMYLRYWTSAYPIGAVLHPVHLFRILESTLDCAPPPIAHSRPSHA